MLSSSLRTRLYLLLVIWLVLGVDNVLVHGLLLRRVAAQDQPFWYLLLGLVDGAVLIGSWWATRHLPATAWRPLWRPLLVVVALPYLVNLGLQLTLGDPLTGTALAKNMGRYYCTGRQAAGFGAIPPPEQDPDYDCAQIDPAPYPPGAVGLFAVSVLLSNDNPTVFRVVFPLIVLAGILAAVGLLCATAGARNTSRPALFLAIAVALSPYLVHLVPVRYQILPVACLLLAVWSFVAVDPHQHGSPGRHILTGVALAAGTVLLWLPGVLWFFIAGYYVRRRTWRSAIEVTVGFVAALAAVFLPLLTLSNTSFWQPYPDLAGRPATGESPWFVVPYLLGGATQALPAYPGDTIAGSGIGSGWVLGLEVLVVVPLILAAWRATHRGQWAAIGLCSFTLVTLAQREFTPALVIPAGFAWAAAILLVQPSPRLLVGSLIALLTVDLLGFLIIPLTVPGWIWAAAALFVLAAAFTGVILVRALRPPQMRGATGA